MVMDYLNPDDDEWDKRIQRIIDGVLTESTLPSHVAAAINIFSHEKIGKWQSKNQFGGNTSEYDLYATNISEGLIDRMKQDQLYIDLSKDGSVILKTPIRNDQFYLERDRADRLSLLIKDMIKDEVGPDIRYKMIAEAFNLMFKNLSQNSNKES